MCTVQHATVYHTVTQSYYSSGINLRFSFYIHCSLTVKYSVTANEFIRDILLGHIVSLTVMAICLSTAYYFTEINDYFELISLNKLIG